MVEQILINPKLIGDKIKNPAQGGVLYLYGAAGRIIRAFGPHPSGVAVALLRRSSTHYVGFGRTFYRFKSSQLYKAKRPSLWGAQTEAS